MKISDKRPLILVVDDEPINLKAMQLILENEYGLLFSNSGLRVMELAIKHQPDLILLDVLLEDGTNGFDICKELKANPQTCNIPVIFVTVLNEMENEEEGFKAGAVDYISKPVKPPIVKARVKAHLSLVRAEELQKSQLEIIRRLGRAAEFKDNETSGHIMRMSYYAQMLALANGCSKELAEQLLVAAPMHDIGKIGIPDYILNKPGKLNDDEWDIMKKHSIIGASIIGKHNSPLLNLARTIVLQHHEKWDGTGYPYGLKAEEISLEARIVSIADVFDALTSDRVYKKAWTVDDAFELIKKDAGKHFDSRLANIFCDHKEHVIAIKERFKDLEESK